MTRVFCDRCGIELTGGAHADLRAAGTVKERFDVCVDCYAGFRVWMQALKDWDAARTANEPGLPFDGHEPLVSPCAPER